MAYGNAAYRLDSYPEYAPESSSPDLRAIRTGQNTEKSPSLLSTAAKMIAIVIFAVAVLSFARIFLKSEAVSTMLESEQLSSQITEARADGVSLEMEQSVLSNPSAIKEAAKKLGMSAPAEVGNITLSPDVVALDSEGALSLSDTVKNVVGAQA